MLLFNWESSVNDWRLVLLQHQPGLQELQNHVVSPGSSCKFEAHSRLPLSHSSHLPVTLGGSRSCLGSGCLQTSSASAATLSVETLDCLVHCQSCRSNTDCSELPSIQVKMPLIHVKYKSHSSRHNLLQPQALMKQGCGWHRVRHTVPPSERWAQSHSRKHRVQKQFYGYFTDAVTVLQVSTTSLATAAAQLWQKWQAYETQIKLEKAVTAQVSPSGTPFLAPVLSLPSTAVCRYMFCSVSSMCV